MLFPKRSLSSRHGDEVARDLCTRSMYRGSNRTRLGPPCEVPVISRQSAGTYLVTPKNGGGYGANLGTSEYFGPHLIEGKKYPSFLVSTESHFWDVREVSIIFLLEVHTTARVVHQQEVGARSILGKEVGGTCCVLRRIRRRWTPKLIPGYM